MPEAGCRSRFPRIQYHAGRRDATALRGESGPETAFRGGFRGGIRFDGQDSCGRDALENADDKWSPQQSRHGRHATVARVVECRAEYRAQVEFKTTPSRYTENKVFFSVPCVYARKPFLRGCLRSFEAVRCVWAKSFNGTVWTFWDTDALVVFKSNLQGALKTRYFSVYLACVRVSRFFEGLFWPSRDTPKNAVGKTTPPSHASQSAAKNGCHGAAEESSRYRHHDSPSDAWDFSGGLRPGDVFSPAFFSKRRHFSLKKWKRMAYYFNLVF